MFQINSILENSNPKENDKCQINYQCAPFQKGGHVSNSLKEGPPLRSAICDFFHNLSYLGLFFVKEKMTGETPEVRSDKYISKISQRYLKDIPKISQRYPKDIPKISQRYI